MIKAIAAVKKQIDDINEYEKKIGPESTLQQFATSLENFKQLSQLQSSLSSIKPTHTTSTSGNKKSAGNKNAASNKNAATTTNTNTVEPLDSQLIPNFMEWLKGKGFDETKSKVKIDRSFSEGTGLVATCDIKEGEDFVTLPLSLFITEGTAYEALGKPEVLGTDRLIQQIPAILLSLFLIKEKANLAQSEWAPYIRLLPKTYNTVYTWTLKEFNQFKGSSVLDNSIRYVRGAMRQYCYLYSLFERNQNIMPISTFTWDAFVWAISTVQSRQNPVVVNQSTILALIPFWDFCNHSSAAKKIDSFFHPETETMTSGAFKNFKKGEQVFMYYGPRDNPLFLLHAGFALKTNLNDTYAFQMHLLEGNSEIRHDKIHILEERGIRDGSVVRLSQNPTSDQLPLELIPFYRIYSLTEKETREIAPPQQPGAHHHHQGALNIKASAFDVISESNEEKAFSDLLQALKGKLSSYPTTLEEDEQELKNNPQDMHRFILYTKINEKKILDRNVKYMENIISKGVMNHKFKIPDLSQLEQHQHDEHDEHDEHDDHEGHGHSHGDSNDHGHSHGGHNDHGHSHGGQSDHGHSHQHGANCKH